MLHRLASALLAVTMALIGAGVCPGPTTADRGSVAMRGVHRCCDHATVASRECCCRGGEASNSALRAASGERQAEATGHSQSVAMYVAGPDYRADRVGRRALWRGFGLAPPLSLLTQRTLLLV